VTSLHPAHRGVTPREAVLDLSRHDGQTIHLREHIVEEAIDRTLDELVLRMLAPVLLDGPALLARRAAPVIADPPQDHDTGSGSK
jgi:hypothetical protein